MPALAATSTHVALHAEPRVGTRDGLHVASHECTLPILMYSLA